jgi:hypothetical protein
MGVVKEGYYPAEQTPKPELDGNKLFAQFSNPRNNMAWNWLIN